MSQVECWQIGLKLSLLQVEFETIDESQAMAFKKSGCHLASRTERRNTKKTYETHFNNLKSKCFDYIKQR